LTPAESQLLEGLNKIKSGLYKEACHHIKAAIEADLGTSTEGRAYSLLAQSQLALERYSEAKQSLRQAIRRAHDVGDKGSLPELHKMMSEIASGLAKDNIMASRRERQTVVGKKSLTELLEGVTEGNERLDITLEKADSLLMAGKNDEAVRLAESVLESAKCCEPPSPRHQVLALIAIANASQDNHAQTLELARDIADNAGEFNLITAVAKAAKSLDYKFTAKIF